MKLLALETSTALGSVALGDGEALLGEVRMGPNTRHAESLLPSARFLLERASLTTNDLEGVVVGAGPGSFTGVRIAAAAARGLVRALGIPLFAYPSLMAAGWNAAREDRAVCAMFDARRGEVYAACYRFSGRSIETLLAPMVGRVEAVVERVHAADPDYTGEGARKYGALLPRCTLAGDPSAAALLSIARLVPEPIADATAWEPEYLRAPGAERRTR